ncbi:MAG: hypothetical protein H7Z75_06210 [Ferruginibacter sp.]|nr:hypothetical protein [Cytophagales bacterium]
MRGDIDIGQRTFGMFKSAGLEKVTIRAAVVALQDNHPYMRMSVTAVAAMRQHIVSAGLSTEAELDDLLINVETRANDPQTCQRTFTVTQVWGRKPLTQ